MAESNDSQDEGYARELAIAQRLEDYLKNCVAVLDPPAVIRCGFDSQAGAVGIRCDVEVDRTAMQCAEIQLKKELRPLSEQHNLETATIEWEAVIPAIVKNEHDHANQVFRVVMRAIEFTEPVADQFILQMPTPNSPNTSHSSNPNYGLPASDIKHVIVLIHGIKDIGAWQKKISKHLVERGTQVEQVRYGLYPAIRFLFPIDLSGGPVRKVLKRLRALKNQYRNAKFSIIAHSFGTYVFLKAMQADADLEFWKIVFCGSVADDQFEWSDLRRRVGDGRRAVRDFILNDCGTGDVWPVVGAAFGWHYGMAGATGFSEGFVTNRFHRATGGTKGGHGLYFDPEFVKTHWRPFLIDDNAPKDGDGEQGEHMPFFIRCLYHGWVRLLCKLFVLLVWISIFGIAIGGAYYAVTSAKSVSSRGWAQRDRGQRHNQSSVVSAIILEWEGSTGGYIRKSERKPYWDDISNFWPTTSRPEFSLAPANGVIGKALIGPSANEILVEMPEFVEAGAAREPIPALEACFLLERKAILPTQEHPWIFKAEYFRVLTMEDLRSVKFGDIPFVKSRDAFPYGISDKSPSCVRVFVSAREPGIYWLECFASLSSAEGPKDIALTEKAIPIAFFESKPFGVELLEKVSKDADWISVSR